MKSKLAPKLRKETLLAKARYDQALAREGVVNVLEHWGWRDDYMERSLLVIEEATSQTRVVEFIEEDMLPDGMPNDTSEHEINQLTQWAVKLRSAPKLVSLND